MDREDRAGNVSTTANLILGITFIILALLSILAIHEMISIGIPIARPLDLAAILTVTLIAFLCLVARSGRVKRLFLFALYLLVTVEIIFQALALAGRLPRVSIYNHAPYGRVYWTREGHANSTMNRYGWYSPPFRLESGSKRIVLIGDSMIQGVQVRRDENAGAVLERLLHTGTLPEAEVLACGFSGAGPTHYLEYLRYAIEYLHPDEAIFCIFIGNDFAHVRRPGDTPVDPRDREIYYYIDHEGRLTMHEGSDSARRTLHRHLAYNHRGLPLNAYRIARSHYLTRAVLLQLIRSAAAAADGDRHEGIRGIGGNMRSLGLDDFIFRKELDAAGLETVEIVTGLLEECRHLADSHGITFRIVTIPVFPSFFFERYRSSAWSLETGEYDFLLPEKILTGFAEDNGISILPLGAYMHETGTTAERIEGLFFHGGRGHFTPAGHRYLAEAIFAAFYGMGAGYASSR